MEERNIWPSVTIVALVAGALAALLYTDRGRRSLARFDEALNDFDRSLQQLRGAVQKASHVAAQGIDVASEGVQAMSNLIGKTERRPEARVTH
jgi:type II secretory pathway pseudopilin PulG